MKIGKNLKIFTGNANPELAKDICKYLKVRLGKSEISRFKDGELSVEINENVRGSDVFIIQPTCPPVNEHLMELLIMIDALKRSSALRITAVVPYYGYARQDRKHKPRVPITAKLIANLITTAGADRVITMDLHSAQIQGFFDIPVDHIYAAPVLVGYFKKLKLKNFIMAAPDVGSAKMARAFAKRLKTGLAIVDKRRPKPNVSEVMAIIGDVAGKNIVMPDDMVTTAGTLVEAAAALKEKGARNIYAAIAHPVLCESAVEKIESSPLKEVVVTNTIPLKGKESKKIKVLSVAPLLGEAIIRTHTNRSVSSLFLKRGGKD